jgi:hypothetical protein
MSGSSRMKVVLGTLTGGNVKFTLEFHVGYLFLLPVLVASVIVLETRCIAELSGMYLSTPK